MRPVACFEDLRNRSLLKKDEWTAVKNGCEMSRW